MGTLRGDSDRGDDGRRRQERHAVSGLPPEWGTVVIPDDPAELAAEAAEVRKGLRREARQRRRHAALGPWRGSGMGMPIAIMLIAILAALASLFAVAWPRQPTTQRGSPSAPQLPPAAGSAVPDIALPDDRGNLVRLREIRPAVILLVAGCDCTDLVADVVAAAADARVSVVVVGGQTAPSLPPLARQPHVHPLADPNGVLAAALNESASGTAQPVSSAGTALLVNAIGTIVRVQPDLTKASQISNDMGRLRG